MTRFNNTMIDLTANEPSLPKQKPRKQTNVLFTCIGRRVSLLRAFRRAGRRLGGGYAFLGTDVTAWSPALQSCDQGFLTARTDESAYLDQLESIIKAYKIRLLIPTIDLDLYCLALAKERFAQLGCQVLVSSPNVVGICQDKRKTSQVLSKKGFEVPLTVSPRHILQGKKPKPTWPCFMKPWDGFASRENVVVRNRKELMFYAPRIRHAICQSLIEGVEYTCDTYVDQQGQVRCVVPRQRLEVRSGEVSKSMTIKDEGVMTMVARMVTELGAGPGVITVQLKVTDDNSYVFLEINPRFGGGVPLAIKAGADFPYWILSEVAGKKPRIQFDGFQDRLLMLRYDDEIWLSEEDVRNQ